VLLCFYYSDTPADLIVIPLSCSSLRESINLTSPAFDSAIIPALAINESVNVDFP